MANVIKSIKLGATSTPVIDVFGLTVASASDYTKVDIIKNTGEIISSPIPNAGYKYSGVITGTDQIITGKKYIVGLNGSVNTDSYMFPDISDPTNSGSIVITSSVNYEGVSSWMAFNSYQTANPFTWNYKTLITNISSGGSKLDTYAQGCRLEPSHYCCPTGYITGGFTYSISDDIRGYHAYKITQLQTNSSHNTNNSTGYNILSLPYGDDVDYNNSSINALGTTAPIIWIYGKKSALNISVPATLNDYMAQNAYAYVYSSFTTTPGWTLMKISDANISSMTTQRANITPFGATNITIRGVTYGIGTTSYSKTVGIGSKGNLGIGYGTYLESSKRYNIGGTSSNIFTLNHLSTAFLGITGLGEEGASYTLFVGKSGSAFKVGCTGAHPILTSWSSSYPGHIGSSFYPFRSMHAQYMYSSYGFYESSDETLKNILKPIETDLDELSKLRKVYFEWKDKNNGCTGPQIGIIAQDVKKVYPEIVDGEEGSYTVQYDKLGVIALDAVDKIYQENKALKARCKALEDRVTKLENIIIK